MDLKTYLESRSIEHKEFAKMIGVTPATISNYICFRRKPTIEIAREIIRATKGKVTLDDLLAYWDAEKKYA